MNHLAFVGTCAENLPRANLGPRWRGVDEEDQFALSFTDAYDKKYNWIHSGSPKVNRIMAREVPMNGFGIADLVTVSWESRIDGWFNYDVATDLRPTVRAFEFKLSNWRGGLMQAHRYRFFADVALLVVPTSKIPAAEAFLVTFRALNVGLWGFNDRTGAISTIFTPRPRHPADCGHRSKAIKRVFETAKQVLPSP